MEVTPLTAELAISGGIPKDEGIKLF